MKSNLAQDADRHHFFEQQELSELRKEMSELRRAQLGNEMALFGQEITINIGLIACVAIGVCTLIAKLVH